MNRGLPFRWLLASILLLIALVAGVLWASGLTPERLYRAWTEGPNAELANPPQQEDIPPEGQKIVIESVYEGGFREEVLQSSIPVLVDFYADWCGPCRILAPRLLELARETTRIRIVKLDVERNPGLAAEYQVQGIPCLILFKQGRAVGRLVGLASLDELRTFVEEALAADATAGR